ncbi:MAG: hypothetical protein ILM98_07765 [Kiritimatiellae bacterium]|nr:hypothetical protein [Kiritimatiellia bacterium]
MNRKLATFAIGAAAAASLSAKGLLLVLPANENLINLGFDLMRLEPAGAVEMACYGGIDEVKTLEVFDRHQGRWLATAQTSWINGSIRGAQNDALVIVGDTQASADLLDTASWANNILTPDGHSFHEVVNAVHSVMPLSKKQWKMLEKGYGITMREIKAPSRYDRYTRYERGERGNAAVSVPVQPTELPPEVELKPTEVIVTTPIPAVEAAPAVVETPVADPAPAVVEAPAVESAPAVEVAPVVIETPVVEPAPAVEVASAVEVAPVEVAPVEVAPVAVEAPAVETAPAVAPVATAIESAAVAAPVPQAEAASDDVRFTVREALDKAKAEVEGVRTEAAPALAIAAPEIDLDVPAPPAPAVPEVPVAPQVAVPVVPEMPAIPASANAQ